jgi:hypothetical protein
MVMHQATRDIVVEYEVNGNLYTKSFKSIDESHSFTGFLESRKIPWDYATLITVPNI